MSTFNSAEESDGTVLGQTSTSLVGMHGNKAAQTTISTSVLATFVDQLATALSSKGIINYTGGTISGGNSGDYTLAADVDHIGADPDSGGLGFDEYNAGVFTNWIHATYLRINDGVSTPTTVSGRAFLYIDVSDGDLKVKFGDGTIKTISVDT